MASRKNFQSDNAKYTKNRGDNNSAFNNTVSARSEDSITSFEKNLEKYIDLVSFIRWYPDRFLDMIHPLEGGITLHYDQRVFLRSVVRFTSIYGVFVRAWSKCVVGDTLLFTDNGIEEIGSYFNYDESDIEKYTTHSINMCNRFGKLENSNKGVYSGFKDTIKITTQEGYQIEGTPNHPILVMDFDGDIKFKNLDEISIGDYAIINKQNNIWGNNNKLELGELEEWFNSLSKQKKSHLLKKDLPQQLDKDFGLLIGYLLGDGCLTRDNVVFFSNKDKDIISNIKNILKEKFNINLHKIKGDNVDFVVRDKYFRKYLDIIGLKQVNAHGKEIPKCIMKSSPDIISKVLMGLFDTDGMVGENNDRRISLCSVSEKMLKQVQIILLNFGIISSIKHRVCGRFKHSILSIYSDNMKKFYDNIGFSCQYKQERLKKLIEVKSNTSKNIIPFQINRVRKFAEDAQKYNKNTLRDVFHILKGNNNLTYNKLDKLINLSNADLCDQYKELLNLSNLNYFYSKIEDISYDKNHVYDLQMPKTNSFISNGFVSHNTFLEVLAMFIVAIAFPGISLCLTAQTKEAAAKLLKDKYNEVIRHYPMMKNEIFDSHFQQNDADIIFTNGSVINILANSQTSKGQRRTRISIEEAALLDDVVFQDALKPIPEMGRYTVGKLGVMNPEELNQKIDFFSTPGYRGTTEFSRCLNMAENMATLNGEIVLGADWMLGCWYGRGSTKSQILSKKKDMSPISFSMNYGGKWAGTVDGALVEINKLLKLRTLKESMLENKNNSEIILSVDVARSEKASNNQSSISVLRIERNQFGRIRNVQEVNIINMSNSLNFKDQAIEVKRTKNIYRAKVICVDVNGLGAGLRDELLQEHYDPITGENLGCYDTINSDVKPEIEDSPKIIYEIMAQGINSDIIVNFIDMVGSGKLQLLEKRVNANYDVEDFNFIKSDVVPFMNTDILIEEIANLKLEVLQSGKLSIKQVTKRIDKDKYASLAYGLYYIKMFEDNIYETEEEEIMLFID